MTLTETPLRRKQHQTDHKTSNLKCSSMTIASFFLIIDQISEVCVDYRKCEICSIKGYDVGIIVVGTINMPHIGIGTPPDNLQINHFDLKRAARISQSRYKCDDPDCNIK